MEKFIDYYNEKKPGAFSGVATFQRTVQNPNKKVAFDPGRLHSSQGFQDKKSLWLVRNSNFKQT